MSGRYLFVSHDVSKLSICYRKNGMYIFNFNPVNFWDKEWYTFLHYHLIITMNHANVRYLWALVWPQYPPPETRPRLHNPLILSWELKSSSTGPKLWGKTSETAIPKWTQMVQSPPRTFWYVFYMNINVRLDVLKIVGQQIMMSPDRTRLHDIF